MRTAAQSRIQAAVGLLSWCCLLASGQLSSEQQKLALDFHNELRASAVPSAANMQMLSWSNQLAGLAQAAADKCVFEHNYGGQYANLGENLYLGGADIKSAVMLWYTEGENYNFATRSCSPRRYPQYSTCGHWSQVVQASVSSVGCGQKNCSGSSLIVCEYNKGEVQPPYTAGKVCSQCPYYAFYCYRGLCLTSAQRSALTNASVAACQPSCNECQYVSYLEDIVCQCSNNASCTASVCSAAGTPCIHGVDISTGSGGCVCNCTSGYSGPQCQFDNYQLDNGIQLRFAGGVRSCSYYPTPTYLWQSTLQSPVFSAIAEILSQFCGGGGAISFGNWTAEAVTSVCCPDTGSTASPGGGRPQFIRASDLQLAAAESGYFPLQEVTGEARVVLYVMRRATDAFCGRPTASGSAQYLNLSSFESILRTGNASLALNGSGPIGCCGYYATVVTSPRNAIVQWPTYCLGSGGGGGVGSSSSSSSSSGSSGSGSGLSGVTLIGAIAGGVVSAAALLAVLALVVALVIVPKVRSASSIGPLVDKPDSASAHPRPQTPPPAFEDNGRQPQSAGTTGASVEHQQPTLFNAPGPLMGMPFIPDSGNDPTPSFIWRPV